MSGETILELVIVENYLAERAERSAERWAWISAAFAEAFER
jgi:hypothetical protein